MFLIESFDREISPADWTLHELNWFLWLLFIINADYIEIINPVLLLYGLAKVPFAQACYGLSFLVECYFRYWLLLDSRFRRNFERMLTCKGACLLLGCWQPHRLW